MNMNIENSFLQIIGMLMHRWGTFLQLMSITELHNPLRRTAADQPKQFTADEAVKFTKEAQKKR